MIIYYLFIIVRKFPVAMETLCGMLRVFERVFNTD